MPFPESFDLTPERWQWANAQRYPDAFVVAETERFVRKWRRLGSTWHDWDARWRAHLTTTAGMG